MKNYEFPYGIMFHHFYDSKNAKSQGAISASQLKRIIEHYRDNYVILSADEWMYKACRGTLSKNEVCLTFDDALLCQYEIALPVLMEYNLTAFWFVYSSVIAGNIEMLEVHRKFRTVYFKNVNDFYENFFLAVNHSNFCVNIESFLKKMPQDFLRNFEFYSKEDKQFRYVRDIMLGPKNYESIMSLMMSECDIDIDKFAQGLWMREDHLKDLDSKGHIVGLHSHSHPTLVALLTKEEQRQEYKLNYDILCQILNKRPKAMAHPCNSYNEDTIAILKEFDIEIGFRSNMGKCPISKLELKREDHANVIRRMNI